MEPVGIGANALIDMAVQRHDWSDAQLARELGVSANAVSFWRRGTTKPSRSNIKKLRDLATRPVATVPGTSGPATADMEFVRGQLDESRRINDKYLERIEGILRHCESIHPMARGDPPPTGQRPFQPAHDDAGVLHGRGTTPQGTMSILRKKDNREGR